MHHYQYFIHMPGSQPQVFTPNDQQVHFRVDLRAATAFQELTHWQWFVLMVVLNIAKDHLEGATVSYSLLHRYSVPWWLQKASQLNRQFLWYLLTFGRQPLVFSFGYHAFLLFLGHSVSGIYDQMDQAIGQLIEQNWLSYTKVQTSEGETSFYGLTLQARQRLENSEV